MEGNKRGANDWGGTKAMEGASGLLEVISEYV